MEQDFWRTRWAQGQIGFHQAQVNPYLRRYWPNLGQAGGGKVLVPLCGKSLDLVWLAAQGHAVLGVELAERAVADFFAEQGLEPEIERRGAFQVHRAGRLELWCGDFFALQAEDVAGCTALYDRAALIALPPAMRARYAAHLAAMLSAPCDGLLVSLEYPQAQLEGPPFSVEEEEVRALLAAAWQLDRLERMDVLSENERFALRGLRRMDEVIYRLSRQA